MSANSFFREAMSQGGWFRQLRCLVKELGFELSGFLHFLIDFQIRHADGQDWFFCTAKKIEDEVGISCKVQTKLLKRLVELDLIEFKKMGLPCKRYIRIDHEKFMELVEKASSAHLGVTSEDESPLVAPDRESLQTPDRAPPSICKGDRKKEDVSEGSSRTSSKEIDGVVEHYRSHKPKARPGQKERKKISDRLKEGWTVDELRTAIDGNFRSPWHCGENAQETCYHNFELIMRDSDKVAQFIELAEQHKPSGGSNGEPVHCIYDLGEPVTMDDGSEDAHLDF